MLFQHYQNLNIWYPQNNLSYWHLNWSDQYDHAFSFYYLIILCDHDHAIVWLPSISMPEHQTYLIFFLQNKNNQEQEIHYIWLADGSCGREIKVNQKSLHTHPIVHIENISQIVSRKFHLQ